MTVLDEFYESYLHYTVAQRLFEDRCRELIGFAGSPDERQSLVDETLRLAMCVSDNIDDTEALLSEAVRFLHSKKADGDVLKAMSYIANNLKEDRARASSYSNFVTYRRIGNRTRKPRKPQIANPFLPIIDDGPVEAVVIPPREPDDIIRMTIDGTDQEVSLEHPDDVSEEEEFVDITPPDEDEPVEYEEEPETIPEDDEPDPDRETDDGRNPLALESERIANNDTGE